MADDPSNAPAPAPAPEMFSHEYVKELRRENKGLRERLRENEDKVIKAEQAVKDAGDAAARTTSEAKTAADQRIARAELKAAAIKAGIVDLDGLKLVDTDKLTLNDKGELDGADALIESLKKDKPYLFGDPQSSHTGPVPKKEDPTPKLAKDMTDAEYAAEKAALIKR